jgi:DNA-binding PadR family transcriptional regulator
MIYKTLGNLEVEGMVRVRRERKGLMPERRVYRLTPRGGERLAKLVEKSLLDKNHTWDLSNLGYFFLFALSKDRTLECLKQKKILLDKTLSSLRKKVDAFRGKAPANRVHALEKEYDLLLTELHYLNKMITGVEHCLDWRQDVFMAGDRTCNGTPEDTVESPARRAGGRGAQTRPHSNA